jgi:hypothetical protein
MPVVRLFKDTFDRADSTNLGVNWEERQGDLEINANLLRTVGGVQHVGLWRGASPADVRVTAADASTTDINIGVALRVGVGATPDFYATTFLSGFPNTFQLWKRVSAALVQVGSNVAITRVVGAEIRIQAQGIRLRTYYNGAIAHDQVNAEVTAGAPGAWGNGQSGVRLNTFEALGEFEWAFAPNRFRIRPLMSNEMVPYKSGFEQRNLLWERPRFLIPLEYHALTDTERKQMQEFLLRRRGIFEAFLFQNPLLPNPAGEYFGLGNATKTKFKIMEDWAAAVTTYTNGVIDSPQPTVDYFTGVVTYAAAPAQGAVLTYDATNAKYRVHFAEDYIDFDRVVHDRWGTTVELVQEKTLIDGVAQ